ncbi:MAG: hypothetical protein H7Z72_06250 [Bacteroidetes bacterium]|nr:hypothetical protein [Fibrella sp.]
MSVKVGSALVKHNHIHTRLLSFLLSMILIWGCQPSSFVEPFTTGLEPEPYRIVRDSLTSGTYLGITINDDAATVYPAIQTLQASKGVTYLNVVSNVFSDLTPLKDRLSLYQTILLDQKPGSDSGVQITVEGQAVKSIYLNSGRQLTQWPERLDASSSVRVGDTVSSLYDKLINVQAIGQYANKFDYISLLTKNLSTSYDAGMDQSPQWYFGYSTGPNQMDQIQIHFQGGKVSKLYIDHYSKY